MVKLTDDERTRLEPIADEQLAPASPLQAVVDALIGLQFVTVDSEGGSSAAYRSAAQDYRSKPCPQLARPYPRR
jgi:hypothetical protein